MKPAAILLAALSALPVAPRADAPLQGGPDPTFKQQLQKLSAQNDKDGMAKLAKSRPDDAIAWIVVTSEEIANRSSDELEAFSQILRDAWKAGIGSEFAEREYQALKTLGANRRDRNDLKQRFDAAEAEFRSNLERKEGMAFQNVIDELDVVAPGLEQVGDWYRAAQAWILQGRACDEPLRAEAADLHKACLAYIRAIDACDKLDLKDATYPEIGKRKAALVAKGYDKKKEQPAAPGAPGGAEPAPAAEAGAPITVATSFDPVPGLDTYLRPNYFDDEVSVLWGTLTVKAKGSSATFPRIDGSPAVFRVGASDLRIDTDGDGQGDEKLALAGNPVLVKVKLGKGDAARPWAFLAQIGSRQDQYQRIEVNIEPNDKEYTVYALAAASVVGSVAGVPVRIIDDSMDGLYGSKPQTWGEPGLSKDVFQPEMDSIVIGASKRARPWSEVQEIGDKWYKLAPDQAGKEIKATPLAVETGLVKLEFKGPAPTWVVVKGSGGLLQNSYFDLVEGGSKGVALPVGKYSLFYGEVRKGKKKLVQKTLILPGKSTPSFEVKKGQTATLTLGAPFGFDFKTTNPGGKIKVEGKSVVVIGSQGERYERPWNCVARPEVAWRKKGSRTATKAEKMPALQDTEGLGKHGWDAAWTPLDLEIDLKGEKGPVEIQLSEKKHDLFGKVESDWKE